MKGFKKTTGKLYAEKTVVCKHCGNVYEQDRNATCPKCGKSEANRYQRTLSTVSEENGNGGIDGGRKKD